MTLLEWRERHLHQTKCSSAYWFSHISHSFPTCPPWWIQMSSNLRSCIHSPASLTDWPTGLWWALFLFSWIYLWNGLAFYLIFSTSDIWFPFFAASFLPFGTPLYFSLYYFIASSAPPLHFLFFPVQLCRKFYPLECWVASFAHLATLSLW